MINLLNETWFITLMGITLIGTVLYAVHHAEVIAHKTGESYGTLTLSISAMFIEVSLIIAMILVRHENAEFIARDAVFATIMINRVISSCIFMGGFKQDEMPLQNERTNSAVSALTAWLFFFYWRHLLGLALYAPTSQRASLPLRVSPLLPYTLLFYSFKG